MIPKPRADDPLSPRQRLFVEYYLIHFNATRAAIQAGYSKRSAYSTAQDLLHYPQILTEIQGRVRQRIQETRVDQNFVIKRLAAIALANIGDVAEWTGGDLRIKDSALLTEEQKAQIESIQVVPMLRGTSLKVKMRSPVPALELLGRHLAMWDGGEGGSSAELDRALTDLEAEEGKSA